MSDESPSEVEVEQVFGAPTDAIEVVADRAARVFTDREIIIWEGDAATFAFTFVSDGAERLLGWPRARWTAEPTFWADIVVHADDRADAIAYCALATGRCADHVFEYRAITRNETVLWLRDYVRVIMGDRRVAARLRGIMFDVTDEKLAEPDDTRTALQRPTRAELLSRS